MKKIILAIVCLISISAFSQNTIVDVVIDGKPAKMNTATGVYTFTNGSPNSSSDISSVTNANTHVVSKGETLYSISKQYGISMAQIKSLNKLKTNVLSINQQLKIGYNPLAEISNNGIHRVKSGDTLYSIARDANTSVQELKQLNNLQSNIITIGQELTLK